MDNVDADIPKEERPERPERPSRPDSAGDEPRENPVITTIVVSNYKIPLPILAGILLTTGEEASNYAIQMADLNGCTGIAIRGCCIMNPEGLKEEDDDDDDEKANEEKPDEKAPKGDGNGPAFPEVDAAVKAVNGKDQEKMEKGSAEKEKVANSERESPEKYTA
jgi:hypothetical protein